MFELGYLILFVSFLLEMLAMLALGAYLFREVVLRRDAWSSRTRTSKTSLFGCAFMMCALLVIPIRMLYASSLRAVAGAYRAEGGWGTAELNLTQDGSLSERWHFLNEYNGKPEGDGEARGRWRDKGRDWFTRTIVLSPFIPLAENNRGERYPEAEVTVRGYSVATSIEVDPGADIVFIRR